MFTVSRRGFIAAGAAAALALGLTAGPVPIATTHAIAGDFPSKPVQLIVPYRAGGGTDTMARVFAKALSKELGGPVAVVNRKGGGGAVGGSFLKNAPADGYTILMGGDDIASYIPLASDVDFKFEDFRYLAAVAEYQNAMITKAGAPYKTFQEFVAYAKENPGIKLAHIGGITKPFMEKLITDGGIEAKMIAASGGSEVVQLLLGGQIDAAYSGGIHNKNPEQWEVLGSFNANRLPSSPDKPTFKEAGIGLAMPAKVMFMTGAGVPDDVAAKLEAAILAATTDADFNTIVQERLKAPVLSEDAAMLTDYMKDLHESLKSVSGS